MFFTSGALDLAQKSPDWLVIAFVWFFTITWFCFLIGLFAQISCILMTLCCYYFYALNDFHIGTLSWDILLVTLFLMCLTPYHGDYFSVDALRRNDPNAYQRPRPFFIQRLLQLQIAQTFFFTALYKVTAQGNWLKDNPIYYLMNYPPDGVTKYFLLKEFMAGHPHLCYGIGLAIMAMEFSLPFLWFCPKTRRPAILMGFIFHVILLLTLDVPAIFFFLFPAQMLLFIHPQKIVEWIEEQRRRNALSVRLKMIYDGSCGFCQTSVRRLQVMDLFGVLAYQPGGGNMPEMKLMEGDKTYGGFYAFRRLCWHLPMLYPMLLMVYLPFVGAIGNLVYRLIAQNRYLFHSNHACRNNKL